VLNGGCDLLSNIMAKGPHQAITGPGFIRLLITVGVKPTMVPHGAKSLFVKTCWDYCYFFLKEYNGIVWYFAF
jgi:hypothetical protein